MLASAAVWRRLADTYRVAESGLNAPQDKVAVLEDLEARSREQEELSQRDRANCSRRAR